ncbi:hypothetical protein Q8W71_26135 [Methylobacterium sp. NEAU 140]|uniref:hypothetical protein n=1 Tax=Methylobacterium sp. NEAU 140 TaxID=3064945 RepID=UPI002734E85A|nr:hypothetical protein [Methylobacterium sp. NEAU 140]MDP4026111.1 hypothetical protein [Methylobacterium sp. NEAU 140]
MKMTLTLAAAVLIGGFALSAGPASAAPMTAHGFQAGQPGFTQVRMTRSERMMMKKRMMRKKMMKRRMMMKNRM